jgi:alanyl-tRNA synthetase
MGSNSTLIEIDTPQIPENLKQIEELANEIINRNLTLQTLIINPNELYKYPLRKQITVADNLIRLVIIPGIDCIPCSGLHLPNTGSIGLIKFYGSEKIRNHIRLKWKIGRRAYDDYSEKTLLLDRQKIALNCSQDLLISAISKLISKNCDLKTLSNSYENIISKLLFNNLIACYGNNNLKIITHIFFKQSDRIMKKIIKKLIATDQIKFCIFNQKDSKTFWYIGCSKNQNIDFEQIRKKLLPLIAGVGGGSHPLYSGLAKDADKLNRFCKEFRSFYIKKYDL